MRLMILSLPLMLTACDALMNCDASDSDAPSQTDSETETETDDAVDSDQDGITDDVEVALGTDPGNEDSDGDGLLDGDEFFTVGTDPLDEDSDDDGLSDGEEVDAIGTDPLDADSDGGGVDDGLEVEEGTDPLDASDDGFIRYVKVQDIGPNPSGEFPGADIDAIKLIKANGDEFFATAVVDEDVSCQGNFACVSDNLLGEIDAVDEGGTCFQGGLVDANLFFSTNGGYVVVEFTADDGSHIPVENGDAIHVYELGFNECQRFDNDPYTVSVGAFIDQSFVEMGDGGAWGPDGNIVPVSGL